MEIISWDHLNDYVTKGLPALLPVKSSRQASLFLGYGATPLGLRIPAGAAFARLRSRFRQQACRRRSQRNKWSVLRSSILRGAGVDSHVTR